MATGRLTVEGIGKVVDAHALDTKSANAATALALDVIDMIIERCLSPEETACALEILRHLRQDRC
jgi:CBS-domain-containing membrane protein